MAKTKEKNFLEQLIEKENQQLIDNGVQTEFPKAILKLKESDFIPYPCKRLDLRDMIIFPIDNDSTKDRDDALSINLMKDFFRLGVHLADVPAIVPPHSILYEVAKERGSSIYLPSGRVIPMFPDIISQELCSLECKDCLTVSVFIDIDFQGNILDFKIAKSIIHPVLTGVYSEVNAFLAGRADAKIKSKYAPAKESLVQLQRLAKILRRKRRENGASISIDTKPPRIDIIDNNVVLMPPDNGISHQIVEECMVAANACIASFFKANDSLPSLFRVQDKINEQAFYCTDHSWHESLSVDYAHCTSPIRRFPDYINMAILSAFLAGASTDALHFLFDAELEEVAPLATHRYRRARNIQQAVSKIAYKEYLEKNSKKQFHGRICDLSCERTALIRMDGINLCIQSNYKTNEFAIGRPIFFELNFNCKGAPYKAYHIRTA